MEKINDGEHIKINRVLEVDALNSRTTNHVQLRALKTRRNPDEEAPECHYSPIEDIMVLQHALIALVFKCEQDNIATRGELFGTLIETFQDMYIDSNLHDSVTIEEGALEDADENQD